MLPTFLQFFFVKSTDANLNFINDSFDSFKGTKSRCGNLRIFLSLRFYVKSMLEDLKLQFKPSKSAKIQRKTKSKCIKMAYFETIYNLHIDWPTLISRKIWVTEKIYDFHIVSIAKYVWVGNTVKLEESSKEKQIDHKFPTRRSNLRLLAHLKQRTLPPELVVLLVICTVPQI